MSASIESRAEAVYMHLRTNPFSTRWTRPGAIPFVFPDGTTVDNLMQRLEQSAWRGAIVGPHGSGKSTLLATLLPAIAAHGRRTRVVKLHGGQRRLPRETFKRDELDRGSILVIDGYEQLGWFRRWHLAAHCRRRGCGPLVTSHNDCGLPILFTTAPDVLLVERLIACCLPSHEDCITPADIQRAWRRHGANVREVFFELYDLFEARSRRRSDR